MNSSKIRAISRYASLVLSVAAIAIAFRSCVAATESQNVARGEYNSKRHIVLICDQEASGNSYTLRPHRPDTVIVGVQAVFPSKFEDFAAVYDGGIWLLVDTNKKGLNVIDLGTRIDTARKAFDKYQGLYPRRDHVDWTVTGTIPVILRTSYIVEADRMAETAVYSLRYKYAIERGKSRIEFGELEFTKRLICYDEKDTFHKMFEQPYRLKHPVLEAAGG